MGDGVKRAELEDAARGSDSRTSASCPISRKERLGRVVRVGRCLRRLARSAGSPATSCRASSTASWRPAGRTSRPSRRPPRWRRSPEASSAGWPGRARRRRGLAAPDPDAVRGSRAVRASSARMRAQRRASATTARSRIDAYRTLLREVRPVRERRRGPRARGRRSAPSTCALSGAGLARLAAALGAHGRAAIKLEDGGPGLLRPGARGPAEGGHFGAVKFRSMMPDADRRFGALQAWRARPARDPDGARCCGPRRWTSCRSSGTFSVGDMSFVGPRALRPRRSKSGRRHTRAARGRSRVRGAPPRPTRASPGIAQIYAPRDIPRRQKFRSTGSTSRGRASGSTSGSSRCRSGSPFRGGGSTEAARSDGRCPLLERHRLFAAMCW